MEKGSARPIQAVSLRQLGSDLGYEPVFHILTRRWLCFITKTLDDANLLLSRNWNWGPGIGWFHMDPKGWLLETSVSMLLVPWSRPFVPRNVQQPEHKKQVWVKKVVKSPADILWTQLSPKKNSHANQPVETRIMEAQVDSQEKDVSFLGKNLVLLEGSKTNNFINENGGEAVYVAPQHASAPPASGVSFALCSWSQMAHRYPSSYSSYGNSMCVRTRSRPFKRLHVLLFLRVLFLYSSHERGLWPPFQA